MKKQLSAFTFLFYPYFIGVILFKKCFKSRALGKKDIKGMTIEGVVSIEGGFKPSAHYMISNFSFLYFLLIMNQNIFK